MRREIVSGTLGLGVAAAALVFGLSGPSSAQPAAPPPAQAAAARPPPPVVLPPLFLKEIWARKAGDTSQHFPELANVSNPNLVLTVYGPDAKNLNISGSGSGADVLNLWTGLSNAPVAATLRDKANYVDLSGPAKIRWVVRTSGFHAVRPVVKLADGTLLVGDHADTSLTLFNQIEFAIADVRWIRLDPQRVVTVGTPVAQGRPVLWVEKPDLTKVDEVGFADLTPGSGHAAGGWANFGAIEVYGVPVKR